MACCDQLSSDFFYETLKQYLTVNISKIGMEYDNIKINGRSKIMSIVGLYMGPIKIGCVTVSQFKIYLVSSVTFYLCINVLSKMSMSCVTL